MSHIIIKKSYYQVVYYLILNKDLRRSAIFYDLIWILVGDWDLGKDVSLAALEWVPIRAKKVATDKYTRGPR